MSCAIPDKANGMEGEKEYELFLVSPKPHTYLCIYPQYSYLYLCYTAQWFMQLCSGWSAHLIKLLALVYFKNLSITRKGGSVSQNTEKLADCIFADPSGEESDKT